MQNAECRIILFIPQYRIGGAQEPLDFLCTIVMPLSAATCRLPVHTNAKSAAEAGRAFCNKKRGEEKNEKEEIS